MRVKQSVKAALWLLEMKSNITHASNKLPSDRAFTTLKQALADYLRASLALKNQAALQQVVEAVQPYLTAKGREQFKQYLKSLK